MRIWSLLAVLGLGIFLTGLAFAASAQTEKPPFDPDAIPPGEYVPSGEKWVDPSNSMQPHETFVAIYGGSAKGTYFQVAGAICAAMQASFNVHHIRCVALRSQGDASNVNLMNLGRAQFAIIQSNTNHNAASGKISMPYGRSVLSLHDELGVLMVGRNTKIQKISDLRGKRVNLTPEGSSSRALWLDLLATEGMTVGDLGRVYAAAQDLNLRGLCDGYIDAYALWVGHPTPPVISSMTTCGARVVGMRSPGIEKLVAAHPYFFLGEIPAHSYAGQDQPIASYGFKATLVADSRVSPYLVYWLTRSVHENLDLFRKLYPPLASIDARAMFEKANFLPFHEGAAHYWREIGWLSNNAAK